MDYFNFFLFFISYSFFGYLMEMIKLSIENKRFVKRGFLLGPWCPVYGMGYIVILFITRFKNNILLVCLFSFFLIGILEYLTSFLLEKFFNARWWDYSKRKFNLDGRICLSNLFLFSFYGLIAIYIVNPFLNEFFMKIPHIITIIILIIFLLDVVVSVTVISRLKIRKSKNKDNTEEINKKVKDVILD